MNNNQSFAILAIVAFSIIISLLLIPAQSDDTIFFIKEDNSGPPTACTGNLGLVLAQNITDLCDVDIINATSGQFIEYNGTQWVNIDVTIGTGNATVLEDLGDVCENVSPTFDFAFFRFDPNDSCWRDMSASLDDLSDVSTPNPTQGDVLTWDTTGFSAWKDLPNTDTTQCINVGGGILIIKNSTSGICYVKSLVAGTGITISNSTDTITITNSAPDDTVCANVGSGTQVYKDGECNFKTLVGSADISITNTTNTVVIDYNGTHVTSVTSNDNTTLGVVPTTGNVVLYPTLKKLCEFVGVGGETSITCTFSSSQQVFSVQVHYNSSVTNTVWALRFNNDTGANYSQRIATNGGADSATNGQVFLFTQTTTANQMNSYFLDCHDHSSTFEKWCVGERIIMANGAGASPSRVELYGKWADRTNDITSINLTRTASTGTLVSGSHIIVWGYS